MKHCILLMVAIFLCITSLGFAQESKDSVKINDILTKVPDEIADGYNFKIDSLNHGEFIPETQKFEPLILLFNNPYSSNIKLSMINIAGDTVQIIRDTIWDPGQYALDFSQVKVDNVPISSGIYVVTFEAKTFEGKGPFGPPASYFKATKKVVLMK